jgi:WhiB family transcriptional regulator, redox-sensing transcriptional regulator
VTEAAPLDIAGGEDEEDTPWRARAECRDQDATLWYPEQGQTMKAGRAVCAACPVAAQCLEHSIATYERQGCWAGSSDRQRRRLRMVWFTRAHDHRADCTDPGCRWCRTVDAHIASIAEPEGPQQLNGPGARCGFKSTYARGHRCGPCTLAVSPAGERLRAAGHDIATWWAIWFGDNTSRDLVRHAKLLAAPVAPDELAFIQRLRLQRLVEEAVAS